MVKNLSKGQVDALDEMLRRGTLEGGQAEAARELVRRSRASGGKGSDRQRKLDRIAEIGNSGTGAFMSSFADTATMGLAGRAVDAVNAGTRRLGAPSMTRDERMEMDEQQAADNPMASAAGTVGGALAGGAAAGGAAARAGFRPAQRFGRRMAQYAGAGGAAGAAENVIREGEVDSGTAVSAGIGALTGGAAGGVAEKVLPAVAPKVSRAWRKLANKLQTPVEDMAAFIEDTTRSTGVAPSIAQAVHARDQGVLQGWAARHNTFGTAMDDAARRAPGEDLSVGKLEAQRDQRATDTMNAPEAGARMADALDDGGHRAAALTDTPAPTPRTVRETEVDLPSELLSDPSFNRAVPRAMRKKVMDAEAGQARLTTGDVDVIRRRLRRMESSPANLGEDFKDVADELETLAGDQVPEYRQMVSDYRDASDRIRGFGEGMSGRAASEGTGETGRSVRRTAEGAAGHDAGARTRQGQRALRTMAPGTPAAEGDLPGLEEMGRGAAHMAVGGKALGTFHVVRGMMDMLPQSYQRELAEGLLTRDPRRIQQTLGQMRQAGADLQDIRRLSGGLSAIMGANASQAAGGEQ